MIQPSPSGYLAADRRRGMTFVELLVAIAVASIFLTGIVTAVAAILDASRQATLLAEATRSARAALQTMSVEIAATDTTDLTANGRMEGTTVTQTRGDGVDNDGDGTVDEETLDGLDNDTDGQQRHAQLSTAGGPGSVIFERPLDQTILETGDAGVDEDFLWSQDTLSFVQGTFRVTYAVETLDGRDNTLVRRRLDLLNPADPEQIDPLAFDVVSFKVLYYDPNWQLNSDPVAWQTAWDSTAASGPLAFPPVVKVVVGVYAGQIPLAEVLAANRPVIETVTLETQIGIESALPAYRAQF